MSGLQANLPGAHRYIAPTMAAAGAYIYGSKFIRSHAAKQATSSFLKKLAMPPVMVDKGLQVYGNRAPNGRFRKGFATPKRSVKYGRKKTMTKKTKRKYNRKKKVVKRRSFRRTFKKRKANHGPGYFQSKGVIVTREVGISTTGVTDACYIGHATWAVDQARIAFCLCLLKSLLIKADIPPRNVQDGARLPIGTRFCVEYKADQDSSSGTGVWFFDTTNAGDSVLLIATSVANSMSSTTKPDASLYRTYLNWPVGQPRLVELPLLHAKFEMYCKSSLKLQNQTVSSGGDQNDEVDAIPVVGKSYFGFGNGTTSNRSDHTEEQFWTRQDGGSMTKVGTVASGLAEMPPKSYFQNVKSVSNTSIDPGRIIQSNLYDKRVLTQSRLIGAFVSANQVTDKSTIGKFRFFGYEHMLKPKSTTPNIIINAECNYEIGMVVITKAITVTDRSVSSNYFTY